MACSKKSTVGFYELFYFSPYFTTTPEQLLPLLHFEQLLTVVYTTFFPNDETQILFLDSDDILPIVYHGRELTNISLIHFAVAEYQ